MPGREVDVQATQNRSVGFEAKRGRDEGNEFQDMWVCVEVRDKGQNNKRDSRWSEASYVRRQCCKCRCADEEREEKKPLQVQITTDTPMQGHS